MRRGHLALLTLLPFSATAWAQSQAVVRGSHFLVTSSSIAATGASADQVVARMMSFDHHNDGKVERSELVERMHDLVTLGDVNGDGALDGIEFRALAVRPPAPQGRGFQNFGGSYGFADETSLSSRSHSEGSVEDLRLASPAKEQALAVAKTYVDTLEATASAEVLKEMEGLLTPEQLTDFKAALANQSLTHEVKLGLGRPDNFMVRVVVARGPDIGRRVAQYVLKLEHKRQATAAVERYKTRLRLGDAERSELLEQMKDILSDEERDNLRAALERRPVVQKGLRHVFFQDGVVKGVTGQGVVTGVVPAIHIEGVSLVTVQRAQ